MPGLLTTDKQVTHRRIADGLRTEILSGRFQAGTLLPSTRELAVTWKTSIFTIHTALKTLVREGWIDRRKGAGTYIANPERRFLCAGIYQDSEIVSEKQSSFSRNVHFALLRALERLQKETQVFIDSRPVSEQGAILPSLEQAIRERRIQCVIVPRLNSVNVGALTRLSLPTAFLANARTTRRAEYDVHQFFREGVRRLAEQGCRTIGLISNVSAEVAEDIPFHATFHQAVREAGLTTNRNWIRQPVLYVRDIEEHGYQEFRAVWSSASKPDGLIVYPDSAVRGVIMAALELGVARQMKFVFHRNAQISLFCPFPAIWATSDEEETARGLIEIIQQQYRGEKVSPLILPYQFSEGPDGQQHSSESARDTSAP